MKEFSLKNNIKAIYKQNKNTPRVGFCLNFAITEDEKFAGIYSLMSRLLLQGTKNRTSEQLAKELDENAIELDVDMKQDYLRFRFICLNEDFELAIKLLEDIIKNPTFEEFEKEKIKMEGEIIADMDSARVKAVDNYYKNIFAGHLYGHSYSTILENLKNLKKEDIVNAYNNLLENSKIISFVGDTNFSIVEETLNKYLGDLKNVDESKKTFAKPELKEAKTVEIIKKDAQQAQILQGWIVPTYDNEDYPALILLSVILGSAGLSSRLFLELREKRGLAYTVRSTYETKEQCANFNIYIATEPKNVQTCLDGFKTEIQKIKEILVSEQELENAKNNFFGKRQFITETNMQQAIMLSQYGIMGLGFDFQDKVVEMVKAITPQQITDCAKKYFGDVSVISILKP